MMLNLGFPCILTVQTSNMIRSYHENLEKTGHLTMKLGMCERAR